MVQSPAQHITHIATKIQQFICPLVCLALTIWKKKLIGWYPLRTLQSNFWETHFKFHGAGFAGAMQGESFLTLGLQQRGQEAQPLGHREVQEYLGGRWLEAASA